jgi:hypothetical protein
MIECAWLCLISRVSRGLFGQPPDFLGRKLKRAAESKVK